MERVLTKKEMILFLVVSGLLWAASFPPLPTGFLAYFMLVFLWFAISNVENGWKAFKAGYIWAFVATGATLWWITKPTIPGFIAILFYLPIFGALYAWLHYKISIRSETLAIVLSPVILVGIEYLRSFGKLGFPWMNLSYTQTCYPVLIQFADIVGNYGVSLWVAAINSCLYFIIRKPLSKGAIFSAIVLLALFLTAFLYGKSRMRKPIEGVPVDVAVIQSNIDPYKKWAGDFKRINAKLHADMIKAASGHAALVIAPETATACYHKLAPSIFSVFKSATVEAGVYLLVGTLDFDPEKRENYFNSAILISPDGKIIGNYYKIQLVPFGEQVPFQDRYPFLRKINFGGSHFSAGKEYTLFKFEPSEGRIVDFSAMICYESAFSWLARRFRKEGADFLVNITNDGWFGKTSGPYQHAMFNVMRAIENRVWIVRSANTGVSMIIDPYGRVVRQTRLFERCMLFFTINATYEKTVYDRIGDVFGFVGFMFCVPLSFWAAFQKRNA